MKTLVPPPDKSITHRAIIFNAISSGCATLYNALYSQDTVATLSCMRALGAEIDWSDNTRIVPIRAYNDATLDAGNSGTTMRLLAGLLAGIDNVRCTIVGDASLARRPQERIISPINMRGGDIVGENNLAPLYIKGHALGALNYHMDIASAQVKSALLLSGLYATDCTELQGKISSRNHTETMLKQMGVNIQTSRDRIVLQPSILSPIDINVPGDISSAAFFMVLAAILPGCQLTIRGVGLNHTRTGILAIFEQCGIDMDITNFVDDFEPYGDVIVRYTKHKKPFCIDTSIVPYLIDEIPILAVLACFCEGPSTVSGARELRAKESDRIYSMSHNLNAVGGRAVALEDGLTIFPQRLSGGRVQSFGDHRIAMSMAILNAVYNNIDIQGKDCVDISYPRFYSDLDNILDCHKQKLR